MSDKEIIQYLAKRLEAAEKFINSGNDLELLYEWVIIKDQHSQLCIEGIKLD